MESLSTEGKKSDLLVGCALLFTPGLLTMVGRHELQFLLVIDNMRTENHGTSAEIHCVKLAITPRDGIKQRLLSP